MLRSERFSRAFSKIRELSPTVRDTLLVGVATVAGESTTFFREAGLSQSLGLSKEADSLSIALTICLALASLIAGGYRVSATPLLVEAKADADRDAVARLGYRVVKSSGILLGLVAVLAFFFAGPVSVLLGNADSAPAIRALSPLIVAFGSIGVLKALFNMFRTYGAYAIFSGTGNLLFGMFLIWLPVSTAASAGGYASAAFIAAALTALYYSFSREQLKRGKVESDQRRMRRVHGELLPTIGAGVMMVGTSIVDQIFAIRLGEGEASSLRYASGFPNIASSLPAMALGLVLLRVLSEYRLKGDRMDALRHARKFFIVGTLAGLAIAAVGALFSEYAVALIYEHGRFTSEHTDRVVALQVPLFFKTPFYVGGTVYLGLLQSYAVNWPNMILGVLLLVLNGVLDWYLSMSYGVLGIALSTVGIYVFSWGYLFVLGEVVARRGGHSKGVGSTKLS